MITFFFKRTFWVLKALLCLSNAIQNKPLVCYVFHEIHKKSVFFFFFLFFFSFFSFSISRVCEKCLYTHQLINLKEQSKQKNIEIYLIN